MLPVHPQVLLSTSFLASASKAVHNKLGDDVELVLAVVEVRHRRARPIYVLDCWEITCLLRWMLFSSSL